LPADRQNEFCRRNVTGRIRALPPEHGGVEDQPQQLRKTGRLKYALCFRAFLTGCGWSRTTQPRSNFVAFEGSAQMRPT
jgi:hypothetical protein